MATSTLVATVGTAVSNTYATLNEANQYFDDRLNVTDWSGATDDNKTKALLQACKDVDKLKFIGSKYYVGRLSSSTYQKLEFPRQYPYNYAGLDNILEEYIRVSVPQQEFPYTVDSSGDPYVPQLVKDAQCEQAFFLLGQSSDGARRADLQAQGVASFRIGTFAETFTEGGAKSVVCSKATDLLREFIDSTILLKRA